MLTLLCIVLGVYLFGKLFKLLFQLWLARKVKQFQQQGGGANFRGFSSQGTSGGATSGRGTKEQTKEGEVHITNIGGEGRRIKDKVGEYVDFDEVK